LIPGDALRLELQERRSEPMASVPRSVYHAWYSSPEWQAARRAQLDKAPFCERHAMRGEVVEADTVNHRTPHRGDWRLFIDPANHESVCKACHDGLIQREEARGYRIGCDADGRPIDESHPWNVARRSR
jgi:5-methylcytosine-specific restriction protein A